MKTEIKNAKQMLWGDDPGQAAWKEVEIEADREGVSLSIDDIVVAYVYIENGVVMGRFATAEQEAFVELCDAEFIPF
jgi:hypothetical protein